MQSSLQLDGRWRRVFNFLSGAGMMLFSALTIRHFFAANYPATLFEGSFCDSNAFFLENWEETGK